MPSIRILISMVIKCILKNIQTSTINHRYKHDNIAAQLYSHFASNCLVFYKLSISVAMFNATTICPLEWFVFIRKVSMSVFFTTFIYKNLSTTINATR